MQSAISAFSLSFFSTLEGDRIPKSFSVPSCAVHALLMLSSALLSQAKNRQAVGKAIAVASSTKTLTASPNCHDLYEHYSDIYTVFYTDIYTVFYTDIYTVFYTDIYTNIIRIFTRSFVRIFIRTLFR